MKKIITLALMLVFTNMAMSQGSAKGNSNEEKAQRITSNWATRLSLTDAQKTASYNIVRKKKNKRDAILDKYKMVKDDKAKQAELDALRTETKTEMKAELGTT